MSEPTMAEYWKAYAAGEVICPKCHSHFFRAGLTPLSVTPCTKCGAETFVPLQVSSYLLINLLGNGGMGSVYRAVLDGDDSGDTVAVKLLSRNARENPANISALLNESRVASNFGGCDFVAPCLDHGFADGEYYAVYPCIDGERLDNYIQRQGQIPDKEMLKIALHIIAAEQHVCRCGYLFRDLKPENIIINKYGYAVLLDFGLCMKLEKAANPASNTYVAGSPYYIPPERLLNEPENPASEIYSLGMIMYFGLTGKNYFNADEIDALARRHVSGLRLTNSSKMAGIRPAIAELMGKMIRQHNQERPQDFISVAQTIQEILQKIK